MSARRRWDSILRVGCVFLPALFLPSTVWAVDLHPDPITPVVLHLAVILVAAKLAGELAVRFGQAAVVGELCIGLVLGNLPLIGIDFLRSVSSDAGIDLLAQWASCC